MSFIVKVCGFLFACILMIIGAIVLLDALGLTGFISAGYSHYMNSANSFLLVFIGAVLLIIGLMLILGVLFVRPSKVAKVPGTNGKNDIYVTLSTIQEIIKRTAFATPGIVGIHTKIKSGSSGLKLDLRVKVNYEDRITTVTQYLQNEVKEVVEASTSLPVKSVRVLVTKADSEAAGNGGSSKRDGLTTQKEAMPYATGVDKLNNEDKK